MSLLQKTVSTNGTHRLSSRGRSGTPQRRESPPPQEMPSDAEMKLLVKRATQHALGVELEKDLETMLETLKKQHPKKDDKVESTTKSRTPAKPPTGRSTTLKTREVTLGKNLTTKAPITFKLNSVQVQKAERRDDISCGKTAPITDEENSNSEQEEKNLGKNARAAKILEKLDKQKKVKKKQEMKVQKLLKRLEKLGVDTKYVGLPHGIKPTSADTEPVEPDASSKGPKPVGNRYANPLDDESIDIGVSESESVKTYYSVKNPFEDDRSKSMGSEDRYAIHDEESIMSFAAKKLGDEAPFATGGDTEREVIPSQQEEENETASSQNSGAVSGVLEQTSVASILEEADWAPQEPTSTALVAQTRDQSLSIEDRAILLQEDLEKEVEKALGKCVDFNDFMCADDDDETNSVIVREARSALEATERPGAGSNSTALVVQTRGPSVSAPSTLAVVENNAAEFQHNVESSIPDASLAIVEMEDDAIRCQEDFEGNMGASMAEMEGNAIRCQENFESEIGETMNECDAFRSELFDDEASRPQKKPAPEPLETPRASLEQSNCTPFGLIVCSGLEDTESVKAVRSKAVAVPVDLEPLKPAAAPSIEQVAVLKTVSPDEAASVLARKKAPVESMRKKAPVESAELTVVQREESMTYGNYAEFETAAIRLQEGMEKELETTMTDFSAMMCHA